MTRRRNEPETEALDVVVGIVQRVDFKFASIAGSGVDFAYGEAASETPPGGKAHGHCQFGYRSVFILREIRCAIEAEIAQAAIIAAAIPPQPTQVTFSIVSVPTNHFVTAEMAQRLSRGEPLLPMIEQNPVEGIDEAQEPQELQALQEAPTDEPTLAHEHAPIEADAPDANGFRRETHATIEAPAIVAESDRGAVAIEMASFRRRKKWPNPDDPSSFLR